MVQSYDRRVQQMVERLELKKERDLDNLDVEIEKMGESGMRLRSSTLRELQKTRKYYLNEGSYDDAALIDKEIDELAYDLFKRSESELHTKSVKMQEMLREQHGKEEAVLSQRIQRAKEEQMLKCSEQKRK